MAINNPYNYSMPKNPNALKSKLNNKAEKIKYKKPKQNKLDQYKEQSVMTAKPEELTLMLYDGLVKFLIRAKIFVEQKNIEKSNNAIIRSQDIITELNNTLNMDYEISKNLRSLYEFMNERLMQANIKKDKEIVEEVLGLAKDMRDTWKEAMESIQ